jgi:hypothetical protein
MLTLLMLAAPKFPLDWEEKLLAALVLLDFWAERVVVGLMTRFPEKPAKGKAQITT